MKEPTQQTYFITELRKILISVFCAVCVFLVIAFILSVLTIYHQGTTAEIRYEHLKFFVTGIAIPMLAGAALAVAIYKKIR